MLPHMRCAPLLRQARTCVTGMPSREQLKKLSIKDLKKLAVKRKMTTHDCVEKSQIIDKILGDSVKVGEDRPQVANGRVLSKSEYRMALVAAVVAAYMLYRTMSQYFEPKRIQDLRAKAKEGDVEAMKQLAQALYNGEDGIEINVGEAYTLLREAADTGDAYAQCELGGMYCRGEGTEQNHSAGYNLFMMSAQQGHQTAMYNLAKLLENGIGCDKDVERAEKWRVRAVEKLDLREQVLLQQERIRKAGSGEIDPFRYSRG